VFPEWFPSSFSKLAVSIGFGIAVCAPAQAALPVLLEQVQKEYKKSAGIEAEFEQESIIKSTKTNKKSQGKIWIKHPNKLRWETISPDQNILISDGKYFWFYTPPFEKGDRGQVIIKKSAQVQTRFLNALLSGSFDFAGAKTAIETKTSNVFLLKPSEDTAGDVKTAEVTVNAQTRKIEKVSLIHISGNETTIQLKEVKLVKKLSDQLFHFVPDRNTDQIRE
jgi:outer membrane lipoprotein carrier protein